MPRSVHCPSTAVDCLLSSFLACLSVYLSAFCHCPLGTLGRHQVSIWCCIVIGMPLSSCGCSQLAGSVRESPQLLSPLFFSVFPCTAHCLFALNFIKHVAQGDTLDATWPSVYLLSRIFVAASMLHKARKQGPLQLPTQLEQRVLPICNLFCSLRLCFPPTALAANEEIIDYS